MFGWPCGNWLSRGTEAPVGRKHAEPHGPPSWWSQGFRRRKGQPARAKEIESWGMVTCFWWRSGRRPACPKALPVQPIRRVHLSSPGIRRRVVKTSPVGIGRHVLAPHESEGVVDVKRQDALLGDAPIQPQRRARLSPPPVLKSSPKANRASGILTPGSIQAGASNSRPHRSLHHELVVRPVRQLGIQARRQHQHAQPHCPCRTPRPRSLCCRPTRFGW